MQQRVAKTALFILYEEPGTKISFNLNKSLWLIEKTICC